MTSQQPPKAAPLLIFAITAAAVATLDLWSKKAVFEFLEVRTEGNPPTVISQKEHEVIPNLFNLQANYNYGAFKGWFSEHTELLSGLSLLALVVILAIFVHQLRRQQGASKLFTFALALLWGGTLGNLYDRAILGGVRDWVKWFIVWDGRERVWPNFNVADSAICSGVALLILMELLNARRARRGSLAVTPSNPQ